MAYSTDDIKALAAILKPIIKSALESGSTGVGDLEVVTSLDSVYSLPALRMQGYMTWWRPPCPCCGSIFA